MKMLIQSIVLATAMALGSGVSLAGDLFGLHRGCNCNGPAPVVAVAPVAPQPVFHMAPAVGDACGCSAAVPTCCGLGGLAGIGSFYGANIAYGGHMAHGYSAGGYGSPAPGSFESGFENLPNMDGGGIHHRYPYHSYRRPWAFPGTPSTNVTIVW